jgi:anti-anti-sigma factor
MQMVEQQVVRLAGELDITNTEQTTRSCIDGELLHVRVDLSDVTFMDCGGYRALFTARLELERRGGSLILENANGEPARVLRLLGADPTAGQVR